MPWLEKSHSLALSAAGGRGSPTAFSILFPAGAHPPSRSWDCGPIRPQPREGAMLEGAMLEGAMLAANLHCAELTRCRGQGLAGTGAFSGLICTWLGAS